jgi:benzoate-CoA ligase
MPETDVTSLSSADDGTSPPVIELPRNYNAAHDLLERNLVAGRGSKAAYIDDDGSYSYRELAERADRFANVLVDSGLQIEQRIALCLADGIDFPVTFLGAIKAGIVPVPVNTSLGAEALEYILTDSRARALVVSAPLYEVVSPFIDKLQFLELVIVSGTVPSPRRSLAQRLAKASPRFAPAPTKADDACFWLYSSGSTGEPKGVVHAHSSLVKTAELYAGPIAGYREDDVVFSASKLPFAYGLGNSLTFPLAVGATAVLMAGRPTPATISARLRQHQPTIFCAIPTVYAALLGSPDLPGRHELRRLRTSISAGEALPENVGKRWRDRFGVDIVDGLGSTEMLHIYLSNRATNVAYGTTGKPVPGYDVRIVNEDGSPAKTGESGELLVSGPTSALFYWNQRERSRNTFLGPWMRTGDRFVQREDGHYVYLGRLDDVFKVNGLFVSPMEVESALIAHEAVLEAGVVQKEDDDRLLKAMAFVVLEPSRAPSSQLSDDLKQWVKTRLPSFKCPRWIEFVPELPKAATGKVQRFKLRQMAGDLPRVT